MNLNLQEMPRTPSPCCTPIVICSSDDDESVQAEVLACNFTNNDDSHDSIHVLHPDKPECCLQKLSDTRWACWFDAVEAVCSTFDSILITLRCVVEGDDKAKAVEAKGILLQIHSFKFLVIFWRILLVAKTLSDQLQSLCTDIAKAADLVMATMETLQQFRSDQEWEKLYKYVQDVASQPNIEIPSITAISNKRSHR